MDEAKERFKIFKGLEDIQYVFDYPLLQTAQEVDLIQNYGMTGQVGWDSSKKINGGMNLDEIIAGLKSKRLCEKLFIDLLKNRYPELILDAQYLPAAIDFSTGNQQAPYTITTGLRPRIDVKFSKFCDMGAGLKGYNKALERIQKNIVERFEDLFGEIPSSKNGQLRTIEKVDEIQNQIIGGIK